MVDESHHNRHKDTDHELEVQQSLSVASDRRDGSADENLYKKEHEFDSVSSLEEELFSSDIDDESKNTERSSSSSSCEEDSTDNENNQPNECKVADYSNLLLPNDSKATTIKRVNVLIPTSEEVASLSLKEGSNTITCTFCTSMVGNQQINARIYLWKWNSRIVVSDVDGTITRSDFLGRCMPLVGIDWSQAGVARLYSAIKQNGYQLLFLNARSISQARLPRQFLFNLKQDGTALPDGPVVISPDGLFPSLYREVIERVPHEFKIACLEDIRALFPPDGNSFHAGFGNRDTDKISYLKFGIPKGNIFIINPKGEILVDRHVRRESYSFDSHTHERHVSARYNNIITMTGMVGCMLFEVFKDGLVLRQQFRL